MTETPDSKKALERLRRWSHAPTVSTPEAAASEVRQRIASRRREGRPWSWLVAAMALLALAGFWMLRPYDSEVPASAGSANLSETEGGSLVVVPLASGTTLYIAPRIEGDLDEKSPR